MTQDRSRKRAIRERMAETGETYTQAARALGLERGSRTTEPKRLMLPLHDPYTGPNRCPDCTGSGVIADMTVDWEGDPGRPVLVCHVFCPTCSGCGRTRHTGCRTDQHADPEAVGLYPRGWDDDEDDDEDDDQDSADQPCYSCQGRRWWPMQAFNETEAFYVRTPCGCSTPHLVPAPAATR